METLPYRPPNGLQDVLKLMHVCTSFFLYTAVPTSSSFCAHGHMQGYLLACVHEFLVLLNTCKYNCYATSYSSNTVSTVFWLCPATTHTRLAPSWCTVWVRLLVHTYDQIVMQQLYTMPKRCNTAFHSFQATSAYTLYNMRL